MPCGIWLCKLKIFRGLVLCLCLIVKRCFTISAEKIAMVVVAIGLTSVNFSYLLIRTSERHCTGIISLFEVPSVTHHEFEVGIGVDIARNVGVVLEELIRGYFSICFCPL
jgi:hypothetical protein